MLEHGTVKFFDERPGKQYGFMYVLDEDGQQTGKEIFFHGHDGQWVKIVDGNVEFVGPNLEGLSIFDYFPKKGDKLAFSRAPGKNGRDKASPWTLAQGYENCIKELNAPYYRVVHILTTQDGTHSEKVIWSGQGSDALSSEFPLRVIQGVLLDPLSDTVNPETHEEHSFRFEVKLGWETTGGLDGKSVGTSSFWCKCDDPRYRSTAVRELDEHQAATKV